MTYKEHAQKLEETEPDINEVSYSVYLTKYDKYKGRTIHKSVPMHGGFDTAEEACKAANKFSSWDKEVRKIVNQVSRVRF